MELTKIERLILSHQFSILAKLDPQEATHYSQAREILENGYVLQYRDLFEAVGEGLTTEECREVFDILDMHRTLLDAYERLDNKDGIEESELSFRGFDGNHETRYMGYAEFLIHKQGRWPESKHGDINSHRQTLDRYRILLERWKASTDRHHLTEEDLRRIVAPINWQS
ncbi:MAG: hypothetical protein JWQ87_974 [Candidatus Sulfotelmatobacter sp.]|nr:hypothetical protein [Candidatus Sulfotelmatobacter sp.]